MFKVITHFKFYVESVEEFDSYALAEEVMFAHQMENLESFIVKSNDEKYKDLIRGDYLYDKRLESLYRQKEYTENLLATIEDRIRQTKERMNYGR